MEAFRINIHRAELDKIFWFRDGNLKVVCTFVLLKQNNLPPLYWALGRIKKIHPGTNDVVGVSWQFQREEDDLKDRSKVFVRYLEKVEIDYSSILLRLEFSYSNIS